MELTATTNAISPLFNWTLNSELLQDSLSSIIALDNGFYSVTVSDQSQNCYGSDTISVFNVNISDLSLIDFNIYPNPVNDILNLSLNINLSDFELEIVNTLGEVLFSDRIVSNNFNNYILNVSEFSDGFYFLKIKSGSQARVISWIKSK